MVVKAMAVKAGLSNSDIASATLTVVDTLGPVPDITSEYSGAVAGDFNITVTFNEEVTGFEAGDITVGNGSVSDFDGSANPVFTVTIHPEVDDSDITVDIAAGVCTDTATTPNNNVAATQFSIYYDKDAPQATITSTLTSPTNDSPIPLTIKFNMDVTGFTVEDLVIVNGTASNFAGGPQNFTVDINPEDDGEVTVDIPAGCCQAQSTGTNNIASTKFSIVFDSVGPQVSIDLAPGQNDPTSTEPIYFRVVFSEPVTGFEVTDIALSGTANPTSVLISEFAPNDGTTYNVVVSSLSAVGNVVINFNAGAALDAAGNGSQAPTINDNDVEFNPGNLTVTLSSSAPDPTNTPYEITITFNRPINPSTFATTDFDFTAGTGYVSVLTTSDNITWTATITPTSQGTVTVTLPADAVADTYGVLNQAAPSGVTRTWDTVSPTVTVEQAVSQADPTSTSPISFTVTFSEDVTGFDATDVTIGGDAGGEKTATVTGGPAVYTVEISGMTSKGTVIVSVAADSATDAAGNGNYNSTSTDNTVSWYNDVDLLGTWQGSTTGTINNLAKENGSNRILLVFATCRRSNNVPSLVSSVTWGGQNLTKLSERTYNGVNPTVTNSVWYLNEAGVAAATSPSNLVVTWNNAPTNQQIWAVFLKNVDQTTIYANVQGGDSTTTDVSSAAAVSYGIGDRGFFSVSSITTAAGTYTINTAGFTAEVDQSAVATFDAVVAISNSTFTASGNFTPYATRTTSNKQTLQGFVIKGY